MHNNQKASLWDIARSYAKIGSTGFGAAMMAQIRTLVTKRGWLTAEEFRDGAALVQLYPGPLVVDLAAYTGYRLRGVRGALVAAGALILPAFLGILGLSAAYFELGSLPAVQRLLVGLEAIVIGILLQLTLDLGARHVQSKLAMSVALAAFAGQLFNVPLVLIIAGALVAGIIAYFVGRHRNGTPEDPASTHVDSRPEGWLALAVTSAAVIVAAVAAWLWQAPLGAMTLEFMKIGSIAYGQASIWPMLQAEVTQVHQWLTPREFIDGLALGQATPGPPVVAAAFTGYKLGGVGGAALATLAIFAPSVVMTMLFTELLAHLRSVRFLEPVLAAAMAAFVGLLAGMVLQLGMAALKAPPELTLMAAAFGTVQILRLDAIWVFAGGLAVWGGLVILGV